MWLTALLALSVGSLLLLDEIPRVRRTGLRARLGPHLPGAARRPGTPNGATLGYLVAAFARSTGTKLARSVGVLEDLGRRLQRIHAPFDVTEFRVRQLGWAVCAVGSVGLGVAVTRPPVVPGLLLVAVAPVLAYLVLEQQVVAASEHHRKALRSELPVVAEQVAMLLGAGRSMTSALERVSARGQGAVARDLEVVVTRIRHGVEEERALREWAELADVDAVDRFVAVLGLHQQAGDVGRLISVEARAIRRDVHRDRLERLERRAQQVWVPVTVATLLPGVLFLGVPFLSALDGFLV